MTFSIVMWRAVYESRNFSFEAFGTTEDEAREVLLDGLNIHADQYGCDSDWFHSEDIFVEKIESGRAFRDHQPLRRAHENHL